MTREMETVIQEHRSDDAYKYMLLDRLRMDCDYYLGAGGRNEKYLWSGSVQEQIDDMRRLYESFPAGRKPEWMTMEQIGRYEDEMLSEFHKTMEEIEEDLQRITQQVMGEMQQAYPSFEASRSSEDLAAAYTTELLSAKSQREYDECLWEYAQTLLQRDGSMGGR